MSTMLVFVSLLYAIVAQNCKKITIRKEVHDMSASEWTTVISTIQLAQNTRSSGSRLTIWESAAAFHNRMAADIHWNCAFFFWHRVFLQQVELQLQALNPDFFFPYWDSSKEWNTADNSIVFAKFGRNGSPVVNDIFGGLNIQGSQASPLRRDFTSLNGRLIASETYDDIYTRSLSSGGFKQWAQDMELAHGTLHVEIGGSNGQMTSMYSPVDPIFYMHHGHLDYMWIQSQAGWKAMNLGSDAQYGGKTTRNSTCRASLNIPGYNNVMGDVLETANLCVRYANAGEIVDAGTTTMTTQVKATVNSSAKITPIVLLTSSTPASSLSAESTLVPLLATTSSPPVTTIISQENHATTGTPTTQSSSSSIDENINLSADPLTNGLKSNSLEVLTESVSVQISTPTGKDNATPPTENRKEKKQISNCPPPLPESWLRMQEQNSKFSPSIQAVQDRLQAACQDVVRRVQAGEVISPMPKFNLVERPLISNSTKVITADPKTGYSASPMGTMDAISSCIRNAFSYILVLSVALI